MKRTKMRVGGRTRWLSRPIGWAIRGFLRQVGSLAGLHDSRSSAARSLGASLQEKLARDETIYLLAVSLGPHNSGASLVAISREEGVVLITNEQEERHRAEKHCGEFPSLSLLEIVRHLERRGVDPDEIHACLYGWDYLAAFSSLSAYCYSHFPGSMTIPFTTNFDHLMTPRTALSSLTAGSRISCILKRTRRLPTVAMTHHDCHAYFSLGVSPFLESKRPTLVSVIDGGGDHEVTSIYQWSGGQLSPLYRNTDLADSLGFFYGMLASTQGGWRFLSAEGRYMGAAAWGDQGRLTNRFYRRLRQIFYFGPSGTVKANQVMAAWTHRRMNWPYGAELKSVLGEALPFEEHWNPDAVIDVKDIQHSEITRDRVDKAAAVQMVFEDCLVHLLGHFIEETGADQLVMTGGTALNCVANMRLLDIFDETWYERNLQKKRTRLHLWVPPIPGDAGVVPGAAYAFAMANGIMPKRCLQSSFYCGMPPRHEEIQSALEEKQDIHYLKFGNVSTPEGLRKVAHLMARCVSRNGVIGVFQGVAETGPRALGHRSFLANPCDERTLETLNARVKYRERLRPLAPMVTLEEAKRLFLLSPGARDADYNAYNYMVLTVKAGPEARKRLPAIVHEDGTSRIQIVRENIDPLMHRFLVELATCNGYGVSVNTSLNIGGPIVQTPKQALLLLDRARGLDGLILVAETGEVHTAWSTLRGEDRMPSRLPGWLQ